MGKERRREGDRDVGGRCEGRRGGSFGALMEGVYLQVQSCGDCFCDEQLVAREDEVDSGTQLTHVVIHLTHHHDASLVIDTIGP